ncbi:DUF4424 family protein [Rhodomicrobium sp.]|uniref:DUF4424 family protein n=1 Tax=Rhodomicrobium sp. TaxID=2720632 RepID=UPI0039E28F3E
MAVSDALANDTSAAMEAGGLMPVQNTTVQIKSEVLTISPWRIEVEYVFVNRTESDVTTTVMFPMPDYPLREMHFSPWSVPYSGRPNFLQFTTQVDDIDVKMTPEIRAVLPKSGRDVTDDLRKLGVPFYVDLSPYRETMNENIYRKLIELGAIETIDEEEDVPLWTVKTSFYWRQTFPAGKELRIRHRYIPGVFKSFVSEKEDEWCTDEAYKAKVRSILKEKAEKSSYLNGQAVKYILRTGANWAGPIERFKLKINKGSGVSLVSTCAISGLFIKKEGETFVAEAQNYTPREDLNILFVMK